MALKYLVVAVFSALAFCLTSQFFYDLRHRKSPTFIRIGSCIATLVGLVAVVLAVVDLLRRL